jgi:regulatory protein
VFKNPVDPAKALSKAEKFCAYQERSHKEVREKLYTYGLYKKDVEDILTQLITTGFLNEERFAKAFAGGKFRMKKWGRRKIENELKRKYISKKCIQIGLKEIVESDYRNALSDLIIKKNKTITESNPFKKRNKLAAYVIGKGYEPELVWNCLKDLLPE